MMLKLQKIKALDFSKDFSQEIRSPLSTNKRIRQKYLDYLIFFQRCKKWEKDKGQRGQEKVQNLDLYLHLHGKEEK